METQIGKPLVSWLKRCLTGSHEAGFHQQPRTAITPTSQRDEPALSGSVALHSSARSTVDRRRFARFRRSEASSSSFLSRGVSLMATATKSKPKEAKNRPVHEIRLGRIRAAIWQNETDNGTFYNVTISRLYKDGDDWKDSSSFGRDDLPLVAKVCDQVHTWIFEQGSSKTNGNGENGDGGDEAHF
jgi:hypothetical protein